MSLFLDLLFPRLCYSCGQTGSYLCPSCQSRLPSRPASPPRGRLEGVISLFRYHGPARLLIAGLKYQFITDIAVDLAQIISNRLTLDFPHVLDYWRQNNYTLVPVPLYIFRQNWRGFNQSAVVGSLLASKLKLTFRSDLLIRSRYTTPQATLKDRSLRRSNLSNSFSLNTPYSPNSPDIPKSIILFDDVSTTGSTLNSAARAFPYTSKIWGLTFAG